MTNVAFVKISNSLDDLSDVKAHIFLFEITIFLQYSPEFTSTYERHHKVEPCLCGEEIVHVQNVLVIGQEKDLLLKQCIRNGIAIN